MNKGDVIGYLIIEPNDIKVHYASKEKTSKKTRPPDNYFPKDWSKRWNSYFEKKILVFKQAVSSIGATLPTQVEM